MKLLNQAIKFVQLLYLILFLYSPTICSFSLQYGSTVSNSLPFYKTITRQRTPSISIKVSSSIISDEVDISGQDNNEPNKLFDSNGEEFVEGGVVRVVQQLKAYHLSRKGFGKFNEETKEFIPSPKDANRADSSLQIPAGLRGVIKRVYDINEFDANQPVLVKFVPGENVDEYDTPLTFMMHFHEYELECV